LSGTGESVGGTPRRGRLTRLILRTPLQGGRAARGVFSCFAAAGVRERAGAEVGGWGREAGLGVVAAAANNVREPRHDPETNLQFPTSAQVRSELKADLKLKHSRRIDVRQARERVGRRPRG